VGTVLSQMVAGCGLVSRAEMFDVAGMELQASMPLPDLEGDENDVLPVVPCADQCGEVYCSTDCRDVDAMSSHSVLCVGARTESHPIYQFKIVALQSGVYDTIAIAAKLVLLASSDANSANGDNVLAALRIWQQCARSDEGLHLPPWYDLLPTYLDDEEKLEAQAEGRAMTESLWQLLCVAAAEQGRSLDTLNEVSDSSAEDVWARVLTFIAQHMVSWEICTPVEQYIKRLSSQVPAIVTQAKSTLLACARSVLDAADDEDDEEDEDDVHDFTDEQLLVKVLIDPCALVAPRLDAVALFPSLCSIPHSCVPTHCIVSVSASDQVEQLPVVAESGNPEASRARALMVLCKPLETSDATELNCGVSVSICRVDVSDDREGRQADLIHRNIAMCECIRCTIERTLETLESDNVSSLLTNVSDVTMRTVADEVARYGRHDDALMILEVLLRRHPHDGELLYRHARVTGWADEWSKGRRLLHAAARLAEPTGHPKITAALEVEHQYYSGECAALPAAQETDELYCGDRVVIRKALLAQDECQAIITAVETHCEAQGNGNWTTSRHYAVPTTDVPVASIPVVRDWFNIALKTKLFPFIAGHFEQDASSLRLIDAFVVRYTAEAQRSLPLHVDQSQFSLTIAMNPTCEYDGGGTVFAETGDVANGEAGDVIAFDGSLLHGGYPVSRGTRYIIVAFVYVYKEDVDDEEDEHEHEGCDAV
jgi:hypothetical protein